MGTWACAGGRVENGLSCGRVGADGLQGQKGGRQNPVHASRGAKGSGLLYLLKLRQAGRHGSPVPNPLQASCLRAFARSAPAQPPSTSPLSPSYRCARSGDVDILPLSSCPVVRAEPSASASPTPQAELLRGAHGAGTELGPVVLRTSGKAGEPGWLPVRRQGLGRTQTEDRGICRSEGDFGGGSRVQPGPSPATGILCAHPRDTRGPRTTDSSFLSLRGGAVPPMGVVSAARVKAEQMVTVDML